MSTRSPIAHSRLVEAFPALKRLGLARTSGRVPVVRQLTDAECGPACLAMILAFYGKAVRIDDLRASLGGGREGTTALSATLLTLAAEGRVVEPVHPLVDTGDAHWREALVRLEGAGASTGRAYAVAVGATLRMLAA